MMRAICRALILAVAATLGACTTLPDTGNFTAAAVATQQATASVGNAVTAEIRVAAEALPEGTANRQSLTASADSFETSWAATDESLAAMVRYAESIQGIVSAGNEGRESVGQVVDAVQTLAGGLGVPLAPQAAGVLGETGKFVYAQIAIMEAEKKLAGSLVAAGPAIVRLQDVLELQIDEAEAAFIGAHGVSRSLLEGDYGPLYARYLALKTQERTTLVSLAATPPAARAPLEAQLAQIQKLREAFAGSVAEYETRDAALKSREATARQLFAATRRATSALALAHVSMAEALAQRRPVSVASLSGAVDEIRVLIEDWKAL
jgi:hypothetical protein